MQLRPVAHYTWDSSVTRTSGSIPTMNLTANGVRTLSSVAECKDGACVRLASGQFFTVPPHNYAQYTGLSFSVWYKPMAGFGATARIFEFGDRIGQANFGLGRSMLSSRLELFVRRSATSSYVFTTANGMWLDGIWQHIIWTIAPDAEVAGAATWKLYVDGNLTAVVAGLYPASAEYSQAYIGASLAGIEGMYVGYLDSFALFSDVLTDNEARIMYSVRMNVSLKSCIRVAGFASLVHA